MILWGTTKRLPHAGLLTLPTTSSPNFSKSEERGECGGLRSISKNSS